MSFKIIDLNYITLYIEDFEQAEAFYTAVFGPPHKKHPSGGIISWQMGATWLTVFPAKEAPEPGRNPCNMEFAIQMAAPGDVDKMFAAFVKAGAKPGWQPHNTEMYEAMYFGYIDDPFGVRIDIYSPLNDTQVFRTFT